MGSTAEERQDDGVAARPDVVRLAEVRATPLSVEEVLGLVEESADGGVVLFVGRVRDHDGGRGVTGLAYEAHPTAAGLLRQVCEDVAARHAVHAVAAVHRTGELRIGEAAVVVAASAPHRPAAFAATRDLIDTLKATVPIWKRQSFADGEEEWVGAP